MQRGVSARTPTHLWIVGGLAFLWNCFGAYDYTMSRMHNAAYMKSMAPTVDPATAFAFMDSMPIWASIGWGLGVWGGLLGAILLLMRSRYAVHAFAVSVIGAVISLGWQMMDPSVPAAMTAGFMKYVPAIIILLAAAQLWYAWRQSEKGVLR